jgi:hypothetical protein
MNSNKLNQGPIHNFGKLNRVKNIKDSFKPNLIYFSNEKGMNLVHGATNRYSGRSTVDLD